MMSKAVTELPIKKNESSSGGSKKKNNKKLIWDKVLNTDKQMF